MTDPAIPLSITSTASGIAVAGEIDAGTAPELAAVLDAAADVERLVVDVSGVEFLDSSGLRVLLQEHQRRIAEGRTLVLARPSAVVTRLFEIAGVGDYLDVVDDLEG